MFSHGQQRRKTSNHQLVAVFFGWPLFGRGDDLRGGGGAGDGAVGKREGRPRQWRNARNSEVSIRVTGQPEVYYRVCNSNN
jgi:hypothetical protein